MSVRGIVEGHKLEPAWVLEDDTPRSRRSRNSVLICAGKHYGMMFSIWERFCDIIEHGSPNMNIEPRLLSPRDRGYQQGWLNPLSDEPKLLDLVTGTPLGDLSYSLEQGRKEFRDLQIHSVCD